MEIVIHYFKENAIIGFIFVLFALVLWKSRSAAEAVIGSVCYLYELIVTDFQIRHY